MQNAVKSNNWMIDDSILLYLSSSIPVLVRYSLQRHLRLETRELWQRVINTMSYPADNAQSSDQTYTQTNETMSFRHPLKFE